MLFLSRAEPCEIGQHSPEPSFPTPVHGLGRLLDDIRFARAGVLFGGAG